MRGFKAQMRPSAAYFLRSSRILLICGKRHMLGLDGCTIRMRRGRALEPTSKRDAMATMTGTIKRMVNDKGFGFIAAGDGTEYFFHQSACTSTRFDDMREGQTVSFTVGQGPKGPRAENVQPA
jgi:CspA family cold shock protein